MSKTLVIVLAETRAHELTFENIKENLIDRLNADLCVCIGVKPNYDYSNLFYQSAKYRFVYEEQEAFNDAFDTMYDTILKENQHQRKNVYDVFENTNFLYGTLPHPKTSDDNIEYLGDYDSVELADLDFFGYEEIVYHSAEFGHEDWKRGLYGIKKSLKNIVSEQNVVSYRKQSVQLHWRDLFAINEQFMGGIVDNGKNYPGSAGILVFFRWFLLQKLRENNLIEQYDRFVITRSDYLFQVPHVDLSMLDEKYVWIPDEEYYGGYTDRHAVLSKHNIEDYLDIMSSFVNDSSNYLSKLKMNPSFWVCNLETLIKFHLLVYKENPEYIKTFPYVMYAVRPIDGTTRWGLGRWSDEYNYYIKYDGEYGKAMHYKRLFEESNKNVEEFYKNLIV